MAQSPTAAVLVIGDEILSGRTKDANVGVIADRCTQLGIDLREVRIVARRRMARIPVGAELVENTVSKAPGFWISNVIVMAGVPAVMRAMLDAVTPKLAGGVRTSTRSIVAGHVPEGAYAAALRAIAARHADVTIGSYPSFRDGRYHNEIVVRGKDEGKVTTAAIAVEAMIAALQAESA